MRDSEQTIRAAEKLSRTWFRAIAALTAAGASIAAHAGEPTVIEADIVVNGGSFSAVAVALAAARTAPDAHVLLVEPTDWLGGQATAEGVAAIDNAHHEPGASLMRTDPPTYYPADYIDFLNRLKSPPPAAPGYGFAPNGSAWVSREAFDPRTAAWTLEQMTAEYPNIRSLPMTVVKDVTTGEVVDEHGAGRRITALRLIGRSPVGGQQPFDRFLSEQIEDWYDPADSAWFTKTEFAVTARDPAAGLVVVDASELADVVVLSGATYTVGRELTTERIADDGTLPEYDEGGTQAFVYPFCMTDADAPDPESDLKTPFPGFDAYYATQEASYFSLGSHSWPRVWTYRRLVNAGAVWSFDSVNAGDVTMQNWYPGNDYPYGTMYADRAEAAAETADWRGGVKTAALAQAEMHAVAWYFYMKDRRTTAWDTRFPRGADPRNLMDTGPGLARFPYVRGTRRCVGLSNFRVTERYFVNTQAADYDGKSSFRFYDSVGIGNYTADIHPSQASTGISPSVHRPAPFYIPYRALGSVNVRNLVTAGKLIALTYITNSAYRLHPIEWAIGSGAGTAAGMLHSGRIDNYDLLEPARLRVLQAAVLTNSPISWAAFDEDPVPTQNGEIIVNDLRPVVSAVPFDVEIYHRSAARARVFLEGIEIGETTDRANGRLVLTVPTAPDGAWRFSALCYDGAGILLDELSTFGGIDFSVVDNEDPRCAIVGTWIRGTAQPNRYAASYHYSWGGTGADTATFLLHVPAAGLYEVSIWYPESYNRAVDAPFTVHHAHGSDTILVNQQQTGGQWVSLGEYVLAPGGNARVMLTDAIADSGQLVVADAVRTILVHPFADVLETY